MYLYSLIKSNGKLLMEEFSSFRIYIFFEIIGIFNVNFIV